MILPVVLGSGKRLFADAVPSDLALVESTVSRTGVFLARYAAA